ncbi:MAG: hypothetical protein MI924_28885 [Chloroflexales bacterium]|nr:hypothetical protein [Chloroflexales bacterium]
MNNFYGLPTLQLENRHLRLEFLATAGPRLVRLFFADSNQNLLAEAPDLTWHPPYGTYYIRGGHRLWHAPEAWPRTYHPDNNGLAVEEFAGGVRLIQPVEPATGICKQIDVQLQADSPVLTIQHYLRNEGSWPVELAPWAITQTPLGGVAVLPQPLPESEESFAPNRSIALWSYASLDDSRLHLHDDFILVYGQARDHPLKVGYLNPRGWIGYLYNGVFFCKRFTPQIESQHPDRNCNTECYCKDRFVELETLAPLTCLEPGQTASHTEIWEFYPSGSVEPTRQGIREFIDSLGL